MPANETVKLPIVYGNNLRAYRCRAQEVILAGPRDTGKTITLLTKIHWIAHKYANASIVIARKQLTDTYGTVLQTWQNKIIDNTVDPYGGEKAQWYDYPNGSRVWVAGLDKPGKVLSAEHDIIYVNQAEEASPMDWQQLISTTTGRAGHIAHAQTIGDCNPASPTHWIKQRAKAGLLTLIESTHKDNPDLYDQRTGKITDAGKQRIGSLDRLTGAQKLRLRFGLWAAPEGAIYDVFDEQRHKVAAFQIPRTWPRFIGIDPAGAYRSAIWAAYDPQSRVLNIYRELLIPYGSTVARFVEQVRKLSAGESVFAWVCGAKSERDWRSEFVQAGLPVVEPPIADLWVGIDKVYDLINDFALVVHDSCVNLLNEIGEYSRVQDKRTGDFVDKIERKESFHCLDALRYLVVNLAQPQDGQRERVALPMAQIGAGY